jgi:hypothetical protein
MQSRALLFALALVAPLGCGPTGSGTAPTNRTVEPPRPTSKERDIQVNTPGAKVDVRRDDDGKLKVDVRTKGTGR